MFTWVQEAWYSGELFDFPTDVKKFLETYESFDFVIPVFHGTYGEDGQITAFLDTIGLRYAYSPFMVHSFCIDKYRTNLFVEKLSVRIPRFLWIPRGHFVVEIPPPLVCYPLIVKPNRGWSSLSTIKAEERSTFTKAQQNIKNDDIIIQEYIPGREFTVWVYRDKDGYFALPIMEILTGEKLFDYKEKYETDGSNEVFADISRNMNDYLSETSVRIAESLECRWVVRIDWRYDGKDFYFLEVNTIPGFTAASFVPKMWKKLWKTEKEFIDMLITGSSF